MFRTEGLGNDPMKKRISLGLFFAVFILLHVYVKLWTKPAFESAGEKVGQPAAPFERTTLQGDPLQLAAIARTRKLVILNFWESWCGPCQMEMPDLQKLYAAHQNQGVILIGIYGSSSDDSVKKIIQERSLTFPMVRDLDGALSKAYGVNAVPSTFVIGPDLKILRSREGIDMGLQTFVEERLGREARQ